jgi:hypothetical protein
MNARQCVHGLDARFCSLCNKPQRGQLRSAVPSAAIGVVTLPEILEFLNHQQIRATYGAVAEVLGVIPRSMGAWLGPHRVEASWVVSAADGLPTDYAEADMHPALLSKNAIISKGSDLILRMTAWKAARRD